MRATLCHVVTSFLFRGPKLLILKRSRKVGTYRGRWSGVSGYIEVDERPLQTAKKEILEELCLGPKDVRLVRAGKPFRVESTPFVVHPFRFAVGHKRIRLDWEHSDFKWISPINLKDFRTVPGLLEAFARVA